MKKKLSEIKKILYVPAVLLMSAMPFVSFVLFETVTGNLSAVLEKPFYISMNLIFYYAVYLIFFALSGSSRFTLTAGGIFWYILSAVDYFTLTYSGRPLNPEQLSQIGTAARVMGSYSFLPTKRMLFALFVLAALLFMLWFFPVRIRRLLPRLLNLLLSGGLAAGLLASFFLYYSPAHAFLINQWDAGIDYADKGFAYAFAVSGKGQEVKKPEEYSPEYMKELEEKLLADTASAGEILSSADAGLITADTVPVNIILIMNESLAELKAAGNYTTNEPYFPYLDSLTSSGRISRGSLYVPVFGSLTSNVEFEVLTGASMGLVPRTANAYSYFISDGMGSLVSTVKDQGYTTVAMHPMPAADWNRDRVYADLGFDEFLDYDSYYKGRSVLLRNYVSDQSDYECLLNRIREKENAEDPLFIFNVTMQNHGGYGEEWPEDMPDIRLTGDLEGKYPDADRYFSLMKVSDEALEYLFTELEKIEEPTLVVLFGDHQPSLSDGFYEDIAGKPSSETSAEEWLKWYQTPILFWTNYDTDRAGIDLGKVSPGAAAPLLLAKANLEMSPYQKYLLRMRYVFPVVNPIGIIDKNSRYYSWDEAEDPALCPDASWIRNYECLVYDHLEGKQSPGTFLVD